MQSLEDCSVFFRVRAGRHGLVLISLGPFGLRRGQCTFWALFGLVSQVATKEAKFVVHTALSFMQSQLTVFPEFRRKVGSGGFLQVGRRSFAL